MKNYLEKLLAVFRSFDARAQVFILGLAVAFIIGLLGLVYTLNSKILVTVPAPGGNLTEGILGTPRFINPLLAVSDADRDLAALVYSGLMRLGPDGKLIPDLAASYTVSDDGLTYDFILKNNLTWQDGKPLTTDDVEFTILKAQDPLIKSAHRAAWDGIKIEKSSATEIRFHLKQPYATFLNLTTIGILPKHLWKDISAETFALNDLNLKGIGSGPYQVTAVTKDNSGIPMSYDLAPFDHFALGAPSLTQITFHFYSTSDDLLNAYKRGEIGALAALAPDQAAALAKDGATLKVSPLPRVFAVFFNQNQAPVLASGAVRTALNLAAPRQEVVEQVLKGYGQAIDGPLPSNLTTIKTDLTAASSTLTAAGWQKGSDGIWLKKDKKSTTRLAFHLATAATPELKAAAELIAKSWRTLGADVTLDVFELGDLNQNVIRPRQFDALFFGEIVGADPDPFAFWHSSQRTDPGLNVSLYTNLNVDKLLTEARSTTDPTIRVKDLNDFSTTIKHDLPAVFIYSPSFIYVVPSAIKGLTLNGLTTPADRLASVYKWYINTERVWPIFSHLN